MVKARRRNLTHIYLTHGHFEDIYGIGQLLQAFPGTQEVGGLHRPSADTTGGAGQQTENPGRGRRDVPRSPASVTSSAN
jgi:glyoxylase-like metal-dependent hydrolase (beta-lactamase superfamily II)